MIKDFPDILYLKIIELWLLVIFFKKKNPRNNLIIPSIKYKYPMKYLISSKRTRALFGIGIVAMSIGLISKKVINFPAGGCMKGTQEITFNI